MNLFCLFTAVYSEYIGLDAKTSTGVFEVAPVFSFLTWVSLLPVLPSLLPPANEPFPVFFRLIYGLAVGGAEGRKTIESQEIGGEEWQVLK